MDANTKPNQHNTEFDEEISSSEISEKRSYYYDDAHGYEIYVDDENDVQSTEDPKSETPNPPSK